MSITMRRHLISLMAVSVGLSMLTLTGAAHAAARPKPNTRLATAGPVIHPVRGAPIRDLPVATPADFAAQPPVPHQAFVGSVGPRASGPGVPAHAVRLPPPSAPSAIHAVSSVFNGISQGTKGVPSDSGVAGGPSNVLEQVNGSVAVYSRTGAIEAGPVTSSQWYGVPSGDSQFDPHTVFDPAGDKFITMMEDGTKKAWMVSVTSTSDATSSRCTYTIGALNSGASSVDFPLMGLSDSYLILTIRENGGGNRLVILSLFQVEACQGAATYFWANVQYANGEGTADTVTPVLDYDIFDNYSFLISAHGGGGSDVTLYKINDSGTPVLYFSRVAVPSYSTAPPAHQKGSSVVVDSGNAAITQAVNYYNGMYATLTTSYSGGASILWMEFNPSAQTLTTDGIFYFTGLSYFDSSITAGDNGSAMYTYSLSGSSIYPSSAVVGMDINHKLTTNQYVHEGSFPTPQTGSMTCSGLRCSRWGDFTTTLTDYAGNPNFYWSASQFEADASHYGTAIAYGSA